MTGIVEAMRGIDMMIAEARAGIDMMIMEAMTIIIKAMTKRPRSQNLGSQEAP